MKVLAHKIEIVAVGCRRANLLGTELDKLFAKLLKEGFGFAMPCRCPNLLDFDLDNGIVSRLRFVLSRKAALLDVVILPVNVDTGINAPRAVLSILIELARSGLFSNNLIASLIQCLFMVLMG